jgi:hypothetical protein
MLGSVHDAEDQLQETLTRAWRSYGEFEGRSSLRTWLRYCWHRFSVSPTVHPVSRPYQYRSRPAGKLTGRWQLSSRAHLDLYG